MAPYLAAMIDAARLALSDIFSPPFRAVMLKSLGLTLGLLVLVWLGLQGLLGWLVDIQSSTLDQPEALPPTVQVQTAERLGWMKHILELPEFERYPG